MPATAQTVITRHTFTEDERFDCLPKLFGSKPYVLTGENLVYVMAEKLSSSYKGGYWHMYRLGNGAYYMAPSSPERFTIDGDLTGFSGEVSADAMGIIACLFALGAVSQDAYSKDREAAAEHLGDMYHALMDYASQHPESAAIFGAID